MRVKIPAGRKRFNFFLLAAGYFGITAHMIAFGILGFIDVNWPRAVVWQSMFSFLMIYAFLASMTMLYDMLRIDVIDKEDNGK